MAAALSAAALTVAAPTAAFATSHTVATATQAKPAAECTPHPFCEITNNHGDDFYYMEDTV
ncbi:hypothetical protein [Streptomyces sp. BA2]|uniref:hypothetical protein n=1 Tax=Streptomyces sp. BA2 TaxID=436595 RepID=UPI001324288D|nr:hypothetical protein [Streptomyces sp. BA2]MWA11698.1 hypothetical protein [Streptomyces sp. BA2]